MTAATFKDFDIPVSPDFALVGEDTMSIDEATEIAFKKLGWPLIGGPSGRGWSYWSTAQRCARLFQASYEGRVDETLRQVTPKTVPLPLQIGGLYHTLQALYYGAAWGEGGALVAPDRGGLCAPLYAGRGRKKVWVVPPDAVEVFLGELKQMCGLDEDALKRQLEASVAGEPPPKPTRAPLVSVVLEAERLFDAHALHWGKREDLEPLAIEWYAEHPRLGYTCRYDAIVKVGPEDPIMPPGVVIVERKTMKWIDEQGLEGWSLDGEILGQLLCWKASGCEERFGKLTAIVLDVVSKGKVPECRRVIFPPDLPAVDNHERWIRYNQSQIAMWRATNTYPQSVANCWTRYGRCGNWDNCALGLEPKESDQ